MTRTSKFFILLLTLLLLSTYSPNIKKYSSSVLFPVKQISIRNNNIISSEKIVYKLDHIKGKKLLNIFNINNIYIFYFAYILIVASLILTWLALPELTLLLFLLVASYHFGKEDTDFLINNNLKFKQLFFLL